MDLFWRQGYSNTSLKQLEEALQLSPPSIYNSFGSKKELFLKSIDHYIATIVDTRINQHLNGRVDAKPLNNIRQFFLSTVDYINSESPGMGCLLTNSAIEFGVDAPDILAKIRAGLERISEGMQGELVRAKQEGFLNPDSDVKALTLNLLVSYQGILVLSRLDYSAAILRKMIDDVLDLLK